MDTQPPFRNRMVIAILSLTGLFVALYLLAHSLGITGPLICGIGECEAVQSSKWSKVGPVPVSAFGVVGYLALLGTALFGLQPAGRSSGAVGALLLSMAAVALAYSAWLTYLEAFVIHAWCQWCVTSAILVTCIFFAAVPELGRLRGRSEA